MHKHALIIVAALAAIMLAGCPAPQSEGNTEVSNAPSQQAAPPETAQAEAPAQTPPPALEIPEKPAGANAAQDFQYTMFDGTPRKLSDNYGKPTVVNFWADWCPPCVAELPHFEEAWKAKGSQFNLVAIAVDSSRDPKGFVDKEGYNLPFANDVSGANTYGVTSIPMTLFIDSNGNIVEKVVGGMDKDTFEMNLAKILK